MDPAGLLLRIANLAYNLGRLCDTHTPTSFPILFSVRTQVVILQTGVQRIQEWLHFTDPASKSQVLPSLRDAIETVDATVQRLSESVDGLAKMEPKPHDHLTFDHDEQRLQRHWTDVRECASLIHLTLSVCQLPIGQAAEREVRELGIGAKTLQRVQTSSSRDRRELIQSSRHASENEHSADYDSFLTSIMDAEADLPQDIAPEAMQHPPQNSDQHPKKWVMQGTSSMTNDPAELEAFVSSTASHVGSSRFATGAPRVSVASTSSIGDSMLSRSSTIATLEPEDDSTTPTATTASSSTLPLVARNPLAGNITSNLASSPVDEPQVKFRSDERSIGAGQGQDLTVESIPPPIPRKEIIPTPVATSTPPSSTYDVMDKIRPLKQSLRTLGSTEYLDVELDQTPVQPYADNPPLYGSESDALPSSRAIPRKEVRRSSTSTTQSSFVEQLLPYAMRLVREDRTLELRKAVTRGRNVNNSDPASGRTLIMEAARLRRREACQVLLQAGSRLHLKDTHGNTALHHSAQQGDVEICQLLLDGGASRLECNIEGKTPLELAAGSGNSEAVLCLLNNMLPYQAHEATGPTLLKAFLEAVKLGDVATAQIMLSKDIEPEKMKEAWKPIAYAAQSGSIAMLDLIIGQKCNLRAISPDGWTALHFAANHGHLSMVERLLTSKISRRAQTRKYRETALHLAIAGGHTSTALALIAHKSAHIIMTRDSDDQEPIHHAVRKGDMKFTSALLAQGAKFKNETKYGWYPIHLAAAYGHPGLVADFMTRGVSLEEKLEKPSSKAEKRTNDAARRGYSAEIRWPHPGARPLHLACEFGHDEVARMLISGGAKIDESDSVGWRPLHHAAFSCRPETVQLLLQRGAAPDAKTDDGFTPLSLGFREAALSPVNIDARNRITDMLQFGMLGVKKSKFKQFTSGMLSTTGVGRSKTATLRNQVWHTAQLAETIHQTDSAPEGEESSHGSMMDDQSLSRQMTEASELDAMPSPSEAPDNERRLSGTKSR